MAELGESPLRHRRWSRPANCPRESGSELPLVCVTGSCEKLLPWCGNKQQTRLRLNICFLGCAPREI